MAFLKRELYRQEKGPKITHEDRCFLVFDTDTKSLYVEREVAHLEASLGARSNSNNGYCGLSNARRPNRRSPRTLAFAESALQ